MALSLKKALLGEAPTDTVGEITRLKKKIAQHRRYLRNLDDAEQAGEISWKTYADENDAAQDAIEDLQTQIEQLRQDRGDWDD